MAACICAAALGVYVDIGPVYVDFGGFSDDVGLEGAE